MIRGTKTLVYICADITVFARALFKADKTCFQISIWISTTLRLSFADKNVVCDASLEPFEFLCQASVFAVIFARFCCILHS